MWLKVCWVRSFEYNSLEFKLDRCKIGGSHFLHPKIILKQRRLCQTGNSPRTKSTPCSVWRKQSSGMVATVRQRKSWWTQISEINKTRNHATFCLEDIIRFSERILFLIASLSFDFETDWCYHRECQISKKNWTWNLWAFFRRDFFKKI